MAAFFDLAIIWYENNREASENLLEKMRTNKHKNRKECRNIDKNITNKYN